jgi:flagellar biosynthesis protein FlhB
MSDKDQKTEKATPQRLRKAREDGEAWQSQDFAHITLLMAGLVVLGFLLPELYERLRASFERIFGLIGQSRRLETRDFGLAQVLGEELMGVGATIAPLFGVLLLLAIAVPLVQVGPMLSPKALAPKLDKLDPIRGLKQKFLSKETGIELAKSLLKIALIGAACYAAARQFVPDLLCLGRVHPSHAAGVVGSAFASMAQYVVAAGVALAAFDIWEQRRRFHERMKMSKDEVKRERKDDQGDPEIVGQRKQLHREILENQTLQQVSEADVMVVNPTHFACALRADADEEGSFVQLVAKGHDALARRMIERAREEGIPVRREVPLARALHRDLDEGSFVPPEHIEAVQALFEWAREQHFELRGEAPAWVERLEP